MRSRNSVLITMFLVAAVVAVPALAQDGHHDHGSHSHGQPAAFDGLVEDYLAIQTALAGDSIEGIAGHATLIAKAATQLNKNFDPALAGVEAKSEVALRKVLPELAKAATVLSAAKDIAAARESFGPLSDSLIAYRELVTGATPNVAFCPMVKKSWLQNGKKIANPYYGSAMLRCGSIVSK